MLWHSDKIDANWPTNLIKKNLHLILLNENIYYALHNIYRNIFIFYAFVVMQKVYLI
jgi:hypothetical protein